MRDRKQYTMGYVPVNARLHSWTKELLSGMALQSRDKGGEWWWSWWLWLGGMDMDRWNCTIHAGKCRWWILPPPPPPRPPRVPLISHDDVVGDDAVMIGGCELLLLLMPSSDDGGVGEGDGEEVPGGGYNWSCTWNRDVIFKRVKASRVVVSIDFFKGEQRWMLMRSNIVIMNELIEQPNKAFS